MGSNVETMIVTLKLGTLQNGLLDAAYTPGDEGYEEAARAWNMNAAQRPALVVVAEGVADVMAAVRFARDRGIGLGVMATGHSVGQTSGAYSLFEEIVRPREGIPPRIGHREDGCFYVVEGELEFLTGEKILRAGAGSLVYVPRGSVYAFTNVGETVARIL